MPRAKSNLLIAAEWLWSHRKNELWWRPEVLTESNKDVSAPKLSSVEAQGVFKVLLERNLIFPAVPDGRPIYHLNEVKEREWSDFLSELRSEGVKEESKATPATEATAPDITEPLKFSLHHIAKNWHHLKAVPMAFGAVAVLAFAAGWLLAWQIVVTSKNATIETLQTSVTDKTGRIDELQKENERLSGQNKELRSAVADNAMPLKKRTLILATQLAEFVKRWSTNKTDAASYEEYDSRFSGRIGKAIQDFDEAGHHSDTLNKAYQLSFKMIPPPLDQIETVSQELQRLAKQLSDDK